MSDPDAGMSGPIDFRLTPLDVATAASDWAGLCDSDPAATVFTTSAYQSALFASFAAPEPVAAELRCGGQLVGLMPLSPLPLRRGPVTLHEIGFFRGAHTLRNTLLIRPEPEVARALLSGLARQVRFDSLLFQNLPAAGPVPRLLTDAAVACGLIADAPQPGRVLMHADLAGGYDAYLETRSGNQRRQLRKRTRELERAGTLGIEALSGGDLIAAMPDWKAVVDGSWQGQDRNAVGNTAQDWAFHRALAGNGVLFILRLDGRPVACLRLLEHRGTAYVHTMNYDLALRDSAPGLVLFDHGLRSCAERGLRRVDFNGNSDFYARWATGEIAHLSLRLYRNSLRGQAARLARRLLSRSA